VLWALLLHPDLAAAGHDAPREALLADGAEGGRLVDQPLGWGGIAHGVSSLVTLRDLTAGETTEKSVHHLDARTAFVCFVFTGDSRPGLSSRRTPPQ
jgi:hypothetical protein